VFVFETFTHKRNLALGFASVGESRDFGTEKSFAPQLAHTAGSFFTLRVLKRFGPCLHHASGAVRDKR
jgi:hypothetical protein